MYTTCTIDVIDKRILKIVVHSWEENVINMTKINEKPIENMNQQSRGSLWSLLIAFDTEHSCFLASEHINSKRVKLIALKISDLKCFLADFIAV
jgi:hypothetical protein